jgi:hypothetical protein
MRLEWGSERRWGTWSYLVLVPGMSCPYVCSSSHCPSGLFSSQDWNVCMGVDADATFCARALYAMTMYPIQAPLSVTQNAPALAWMWFLRSFAGVSIRPSNSSPTHSLLTSSHWMISRSGASRLGTPSSKTSSQRRFRRRLCNPSHQGMPSLPCTPSFQISPRSHRTSGQRFRSRLHAVWQCCGKSWRRSVLLEVWRRCS